MNKEKGSLMSEATLWQLYRNLLAEQLLATRIADQTTSRAGNQAVRAPTSARRQGARAAGRSAAIAAALAANLVEGDTLGLEPGDLATRLLCGVPLDTLRNAAKPPRRSKLRVAGWQLDQDAEHGILPAVDEQQAELAVGTALASRLHAPFPAPATFLVATLHTVDASAPAPMAAWASAGQRAVELQLPLIFITESRHGSHHVSAPANPRLPAPLLPAIPVDRTDAVALYRVIYESVARARTGGGPTWIDCRDVPEPVSARSRTAATPNDPLMKVEETLRGRQLFHKEQQRHIERALVKEFVLAGWPEED